MPAGRRRINHTERILNEKTLHANNLLPGMIIRFSYNAEDIYDRRPLVLFLYKEDKTLQGINLNYIKEFKVQEIFDRSIQLFEGRIDEAFRQEHFYNLKGHFTRIGLTNKLAPSDVDTTEFYNRVIKPRLLNVPDTKNCYRSYILKNISSLKIVNYKIDTFSTFKETGEYRMFGENFTIEKAVGSGEMKVKRL